MQLENINRNQRVKEKKHLGKKMLSVNLKVKCIGEATAGTVWQLGTWNPGPCDCVLGIQPWFSLVQSKTFPDKSVEEVVVG